MLSLTFVLLDICLYEIGVFVVLSKNMRYTHFICLKDTIFIGVSLDIEHLPTTAGVIMILRISYYSSMFELIGFGSSKPILILCQL